MVDSLEKQIHSLKNWLREIDTWCMVGQTVSLNEAKPVEKMKVNLQNFQSLSHVEKKLPISHVLQDNAYEWRSLSY